MVSGLTIEEIDKRIADLNDKVSDLHDEIYDLNMARRSIIESQWQLTNDVLKVKPGAIVVAITHHYDYHRILAKVFVVDSCDSSTIECTTHSYRTDDGEISMWSRKESFSASIFHIESEEYNLYSIDDSWMSPIMGNLISLNADIEGIKEMETLLKGDCLGCIVTHIPS